MLYVLLGFVLGLVFIKLQDRLERWYTRHQQKALFETRMQELRNGRENSDLTVKIDPIS